MTQLPQSTHKPLLQKSTIGLSAALAALLLSGATQAASLTPTTLNVKFAVIWDQSNISPNAQSFGLATDQETWTTTLKLGNEPFVASANCTGATCPTSLTTTETSEASTLFNIVSSSEIPSTSDAAMFDTLTSRDVFEYSSNIANSNSEYFSITDETFGRYVPTVGNQMVTWGKTRTITTPNLPLGTIAKSSAGVFNTLSNTSITYAVTDYFVNNVLQVAYGKTGRAHVVSITQVNPTTPPPVAPATCSYQVFSDWGTGFTAQVTIKNETSSPITGWQLAFNFPSGAAIGQYWSAAIKGTAPAYSASPASWNTTILPGQQINFGFNGVKQTGQSPAAKISSSLCR